MAHNARDIEFDCQRHGEMEFRNLLEKLPTGAYTCDRNGLITYFNPAAAHIWGREPKLKDPGERYCGSFRLFAPDGSPIAHYQCWTALALKMDAEFNGHEMVIERPDARRVTVLAHATPMHDTSGKLIGAVNVLVDITDRKRAEAALREADKAKNAFLATLAHELRNPLAPIRNAAQVLHLQNSASPELHWALEVIDRQMRQMTRLIDELLDMARITANKLELRRERVELSEVLRAAVETSRPLIEAGGVQLIVAPAPQPVLLNADLTRLAQVFVNLLNNAAKYTPRGGRIWFSAERRGNDAAVTVRDNGVGIAPDLLPRVFDMFTQVNRSLDRTKCGLGIGLALVKRLVEMHGGSIEARSEGAGKGSAFIVRLPLAVEVGQVNSPFRAERERIGNGSHLHILVVDDNVDTAASLSMLLRSSGNDVRTAADGIEAIAAVDEFRPDVVLLDIGLPGLSGYEVARQIRRQPWGREMVLIALTGWAQDTDRQESKESGFDHHLVKPVDPKMLLNLLESLAEPGTSRGDVPLLAVGR